MSILIKKGTIINEGRQFVGSLIVKDDKITDIIEGETTPQIEGEYEVIDAEGCYILPGIIDTHVHFREPGLTHKADIESESRAAAFGGVTSYFDMPNTNPQTTTMESLREKQALAREKSHINWAFFPGATNDNIEKLAEIDAREIAGIKLFMGSSTGNMLVDKMGALIKIFQTAAKLHLPIMAHCEDTEIINRNMEQVKKTMGDDPDVMFHPMIRSEEACMESSCLAANLARQTGAHLHIAHITTEAELNAIFPADCQCIDSPKDMQSAQEAQQSQQYPSALPAITAEATVAHLMFTNSDYATLRALIKCNPAIKKDSDREALRQGLMNGQITTIGTDHAPHALAEKQGGAAKAMSGMPMIQFSLVTMLSLVDEGIITMQRLVDLMVHNPARLFGVTERGYLRKGYKADITIVKKGEPWTVTEECIESKCKWSPMTGRKYEWKVLHTICNGNKVIDNGHFIQNSKGEQIVFEH